MFPPFNHEVVKISGRIRAALGARPTRIIRLVAGRALFQLGAVVAVSIVMTLTGLLACMVPMRRALRIQPIEALRDHH
jgi:hypothetical protein